jgi:hypothetical protein
MAICFFLLACGKKDPPVPPRRENPPPVSDLSHSLQDNRLKLVWTVPKKENRRQSNLVGFKVYLSQIPLSESECKNCPLRFKQVGDIPILKQRNQEQIEFSQTLESGYRYVYLIRGYSDNAMISADSNYVDFVYE